MACSTIHTLGNMCDQYHFPFHYINEQGNDFTLCSRRVLLYGNNYIKDSSRCTTMLLTFRIWGRELTTSKWAQGNPSMTIGDISSCYWRNNHNIIFQIMIWSSTSWLGWGHMIRDGSVSHVEDQFLTNFQAKLSSYLLKWLKKLKTMEWRLCDQRHQFLLLLRLR